MKKLIYEKDLKQVADEICQLIPNGGLIAMYGDLGTGKTTLTKAIADHYEIDNFSIKSPTYTYIRRYPKNNFYHIDLYRLDQIDELLELEIEEIFEDPKNTVIIEWADRMEEFLPKKRVNVILEHHQKDSRYITIES